MRLLRERKVDMKKQFVKKAALILTAAMLAGMGTACTKDTTQTEDGKTVISVGGYPAKEGKDKESWDARIADYEAANPDVKIEPDTWDFDLKTFYSKAAGGQLPTVFGTNYTEVKQCIDAEYIADITDVLHKRGYDGMFNPKVLDIISKDGKIYSVPRDAYMLGMAYNVDLFEAAGLMEADGTPKQPKTWDEAAEFAVKIKNATGKPGFIFPSSGNVGGWLFTNLAWSYGTEFMKQDADGKWKATFNSEECVKALQWVKDLKWKYDVLPSNTLIDNAEYYKLFATGNGAMLITAGDCPKQLVKYDMKPDQLGMFALPSGPARHVALLGGTLYSVSAAATEKQKDAVVRWIETKSNFKATDSYKDTTDKDLQKNLSENQLIGIKSMSAWSDNAESVKYLNEQIDKYANSNPNHVKLYNDFVNSDVEIQAEEPICAQELYGILDSCIQEVLTNKDADCAALLEKANSDFQKDYLNSFTD